MNLADKNCVFMKVIYPVVLYLLGVCMQVLEAVRKQKTEKCSDFSRCLLETDTLNNKKKKEGKGIVESEIPWP